MREANISIKGSTEASSKAIDRSFNILLLDYTNFFDRSAKATIKVLSLLGQFDRFEKRKESFENYITFKTKQRRQLEVDNLQWISELGIKFDLNNQGMLNIKIKEILNKIGLITKIQMWDSKKRTKHGFLKFHSIIGTQWIEYINESYFDSNRFSQQKLFKIFLRKWKMCFFSE